MDLENTLLTWLPIIFFGIVILLLLYTLKFMPRAKPAPKEHPRCGSQLIAPMVATSLAVNVAASKAPAGTRGLARLVGTAGAIGGSVEVFSWVARNPSHPVARALARPGFELQRHLSTAEPSAEQLEVANAARDACLALEREAA